LVFELKYQNALHNNSLKLEYITHLILSSSEVAFLTNIVCK
jgi:hypothetical protein